jgi:hypothetical protein
MLLKMEKLMECKGMNISASDAIEEKKTSRIIEMFLCAVIAKLLDVGHMVNLSHSVQINAGLCLILIKPIVVGYGREC